MSQRLASSDPSQRAQFSRTRWSIVLDLQNPGADNATRSLFELCQRYWYPVYAYARRCGHSSEIANDLALAFFSQLPEVLEGIDPRTQGRFRNFLLQRLHHFLTQDWRQSSDQALDNNLAAPFSVDELERRFAEDHASQARPEQFFHRSFASEVLNRSFRRLRVEALQSGRLDMFEVLKDFLAREPVSGQHELLATRLNRQPLAVVIAIKRLRQRFRELAEEELMETVASADDLDAERAALLEVFAGDHA